MGTDFRGFAEAVAVFFCVFAAVVGFFLWLGAALAAFLWSAAALAGFLASVSARAPRASTEHASSVASVAFESGRKAILVAYPPKRARDWAWHLLFPPNPVDEMLTERDPNTITCDHGESWARGESA